MSEVRLDNVVFAWPGGKPMLFDAQARPGAFTAILGASGSGKSTLLALVAGFETPSQGRVLIGNEDVTDRPPWKRPMSVLFQDNNLFAHLDAERNVALGITVALRPAPSDLEEARASLARVGLGGYGKRMPGTLSGGERQRVALARALLRKAPVLLLDEPFAGLGPGLREEMLELLCDLQAQNMMTVLIVTHEPGDALALDADVLFVESGHVVARGPANSLLGNDAPAPVRRWLGTT
ncbi:MAG: ATP-binding cassette domain-containing protein [Planctomycetales bacterium]|nr:ATP-binding cassette domain-containing protein [Planctomycetales bacterium]